MSEDKERLGRVVAYHEREAEGEKRRILGDDPLYDGIAWDSASPYLPKRGRVLDAGGGAGVWSVRIAQETRSQVVLLDLARGVLKAALERVREPASLSKRIQILEADLRDMPFEDSAFDFALCEGDPICICGDPERALKELSRVVKPHGYLAAGVDSTIYRAYSLLSKGASLDAVLEFLRTGRSPAEEGAPFESKSFTPAEFAGLLSRCCFEMVSVRGRPLGTSSGWLDAFASTVPAEQRERMLKSREKRSKLALLLSRVYQDQYASAIGSHLFVMARRRGLKAARR